MSCTLLKSAREKPQSEKRTSLGTDFVRCSSNDVAKSLLRGRITMKLKVTRSSGNVFRDLGFSAGDAEHLLVRADLMIKVQKLIESKHLTQAELAKILRITQPRVSDLRRGRIDLFSTDALIDILARLGVRVQLVLKPSRRGLKAT